MLTFYIETKSIQNYDRDPIRNNTEYVEDAMFVGTGQLKLNPVDFDVIKVRKL